MLSTIIRWPDSIPYHQTWYTYVVCGHAIQWPTQAAGIQQPRHPILLHDQIHDLYCPQLPCNVFQHKLRTYMFGTDASLILPRACWDIFQRGHSQAAMFTNSCLPMALVCGMTELLGNAERSTVLVHDTTKKLEKRFAVDINTLCWSHHSLKAGQWCQCCLHVGTR
jgi:hypothetical protein